MFGLGEFWPDFLDPVKSAWIEEYIGFTPLREQARKTSLNDEEADRLLRRAISQWVEKRRIRTFPSNKTDHEAVRYEISEILAGIIENREAGKDDEVRKQGFRFRHCVEKWHKHFRQDIDHYGQQGYWRGIAAIHNGNFTDAATAPLIREAIARFTLKHNRTLERPDRFRRMTKQAIADAITAMLFELVQEKIIELPHGSVRNKAEIECIYQRLARHPEMLGDLQDVARNIYANCPATSADELLRNAIGNLMHGGKGHVRFNVLSTWDDKTIAQNVRACMDGNDRGRKWRDRLEGEERDGPDFGMSPS